MMDIQVTRRKLLYNCSHKIHCSIQATVCICGKLDVRQTTKSADFCGRGLVAQENWLITSVNHDTWLTFLSATSCNIS